MKADRQRHTATVIVVSLTSHLCWDEVTNDADDDGNGTGGADILTFYDGLQYRLATVFKLAYPYGFVRIMSSYRWDGGPDRSIAHVASQSFSVQRLSQCYIKWHYVDNFSGPGRAIDPVCVSVHRSGQ